MEIMNVRIRYFDERLVEESLRRYLKEIEEKHPEAKRVLLFGSFVRDECVPGSDIDLLLILSASEETFMERIPRFLPSPVPGRDGCIPIYYTEEELEKMKEEGNFFIRKALEEGVEVFRR